MKTLHCKSLKGQEAAPSVQEAVYCCSKDERSHRRQPSEHLPHGLAELLNLGLCRHVNIFLPNSDNHATHD